MTKQIKFGKKEMVTTNTHSLNGRSNHLMIDFFSEKNKK